MYLVVTDEKISAYTNMNDANKVAQTMSDENVFVCKSNSYKFDNVLPDDYQTSGMMYNSNNKYSSYEETIFKKVLRIKLKNRLKKYLESGEYPRPVGPMVDSYVNTAVDTYITEYDRYTTESDLWNAILDMLQYYKNDDII